jgi:hypothetical protein
MNIPAPLSSLLAFIYPFAKGRGKMLPHVSFNILGIYVNEMTFSKQ